MQGNISCTTFLFRLLFVILFFGLSIPIVISRVHIVLYIRLCLTYICFFAFFILIVSICSNNCISSKLTKFYDLMSTSTFSIGR